MGTPGTLGVPGDGVGDPEGVGWSVTGCTAAGGGVPVPPAAWFCEAGAARAVPAATTATTMATAMATCIGRRRRRRAVRAPAWPLLVELHPVYDGVLLRGRAAHGPQRGQEKRGLTQMRPAAALPVLTVGT